MTAMCSAPTDVIRERRYLVRLVEKSYSFAGGSERALKSLLHRIRSRTQGSDQVIFDRERCAVLVEGLLENGVDYHSAMPTLRSDFLVDPPAGST